MTTSPDEGLGPVVEIWIDTTTEGQAVLVTGHRPDGEPFIGSFWQPTTDENHPSKEPGT